MGKKISEVLLGTILGFVGIAFLIIFAYKNDTNFDFYFEWYFASITCYFILAIYLLGLQLLIFKPIGKYYFVTFSLIFLIGNAIIYFVVPNYNDEVKYNSWNDHITYDIESDLGGDFYDYAELLKRNFENINENVLVKFTTSDIDFNKTIDVEKEQYIVNYKVKFKLEDETKEYFAKKLFQEDCNSCYIEYKYDKYYYDKHKSESVKELTLIDGTSEHVLSEDDLSISLGMN